MMAFLAALGPILATAAPYVGLAATGLTAYSSLQKGKLDELNSRNVALQQEAAGKASQAEASRSAVEEHRRADYLQSRATALAAASGGRVSDPTIQNILGDIKDEGEYRALSALYSGDSDANLANTQAAATRNEGRASLRASRLSAGSTILSGASDFYTKFNPRAKPTKKVA